MKEFSTEKSAADARQQEALWRKEAEGPATITPPGEPLSYDQKFAGYGNPARAEALHNIVEAVTHIEQDPLKAALAALRAETDPVKRKQLAEEAVQIDKLNRQIQSTLSGNDKKTLH